MEQKILKYKRLYKIFTILALIGFIDLIIIPILLKSIYPSFPQGMGLITFSLMFLFGKIGFMIGSWFIGLWFVWGLIALIFNNLIKKLKFIESPVEENKKKYKNYKIIVIVCVIILLLILISMFLLYK